jgi:hypothetical protein
MKFISFDIPSKPEYLFSRRIVISDSLIELSSMAIGIWNWARRGRSPVSMIATLRKGKRWTLTRQKLQICLVYNEMRIGLGIREPIIKTTVHSILPGEGELQIR